MRRRLLPIGLATALLASACSSDGEPQAQDEPATTELEADNAEAVTSDGVGDAADAATDEDVDLSGATQTIDFGEPPSVPDGPLEPATAEAIERLLGQSFVDGQFGDDSLLAIAELAESGDPRVAWWLSDLLRVATNPVLSQELLNASATLLDIDPISLQPWDHVTSHLMAWDIPAPPDYLTYKANVYEQVVSAWDPFFVEEADIDWRFLSWGGVGIDDRPFDQTDELCNCIPAVDNPLVTNVDGGDWLADDSVVFGVEINGEARAYPRSTMEVREMVNDTLGGRDIGMPYCTLCGSAQVYFTDEVPDGVERPVLRTSGLLIRSNKVMFDVNTFSIFDTFLGTAVSGPLAEQGIVLPQAGVVTTTWGQWKQEHPDTTILAQSVALGRPDSDLRNTRDANGPIFPIGNVDDRLPVQEDVIGVTGASGDPIAFQVSAALNVLQSGGTVEVDGIVLQLDGGGVRAVDAEGNDVGGHQAFWFAWSQFQPETQLWTG